MGDIFRIDRENPNVKDVQDRYELILWFIGREPEDSFHAATDTEDRPIMFDEFMKIHKNLGLPRLTSAQVDAKVEAETCRPKRNGDGSLNFDL